MSKQGQKKETDFGAVSSWLEENVLPMLMEKCASPLEAIYLLTSFTKNAALTIGVADLSDAIDSVEEITRKLDEKD